MRSKTCVGDIIGEQGMYTVFWPVNVVARAGLSEKYKVKMERCDSKDYLPATESRLFARRWLSLFLVEGPISRHRPALRKPNPL
jgi:hypothetical protein